MPKLGMEPIRRAALVKAAIAEIGARGSVNVTVARIAGRAGVSSALAHHYFGSKDMILIAAMRQLMSDYAVEVRAGLAQAKTPLDRIDAVIAASLGPQQVDPAIATAWLAFYVEAQRSDTARRLWRVYARRLHSTLVHDLRALVGPVRAPQLAQALAALIDGFYLRLALRDSGPDRHQMVEIVRDTLHRSIGDART